MRCVINRHGDAIGVPSVPTDIDDIHRRIREKGTFDRDDLDAIVEHYSAVDPEGILRNANEIADLYNKLNEVGRFEDMVPDSNTHPEFDGSRPPPGVTVDVNGDWYDPGIPFGSITTGAGSTSSKMYLCCLRYNNGNKSPSDTGYEIEFSGDDGYRTITLTDQPA